MASDIPSGGSVYVLILRPDFYMVFAGKCRKKASFEADRRLSSSNEEYNVSRLFLMQTFLVIY